MVDGDALVHDREVPFEKRNLVSCIRETHIEKILFAMTLVCTSRPENKRRRWDLREAFEKSKKKVLHRR